VDLLKKIVEIDEELHKDNGIYETLATHTAQLAANNNLIKALWAFVSATFLALLAYIFSHWTK
jgi:hypothetical protein